MSYGHAIELMRDRTPEQQLDFLVGELRAWAALNKGLVPLYTEFDRVRGELNKAARVRRSEAVGSEETKQANDADARKSGNTGTEQASPQARNG